MNGQTAKITKTLKLTKETRWSAFLRPATSMRVLGIVVLLAGLAWRVGRYAANWPLWGDEGFVAINLVERDFAGMLRQPLEYSQVVPVGFLWAELAVTRVLGLSEWAVHLLPMLSGVAAFLLSWRFYRTVLDRRAALLAGAVLAASYYPIRHAVEVKPYAGDMLVAIALIALAWRVAQRPGSAGRWIALALLGAAAVWVSLPSVFVVGGVGLFLGWHCLVHRNPRRLVPLVLFAVVTLISFVGAYYVFIGPTARANPSYWTIPTWLESFPPLQQPWLIPWWLLKTHAGNMMAYPMGGKHFGSIATLLLVVAGAVSLWRRGRRDIVLLVLAPLLPALVAAGLRKYPYGTSARVMLYMAPSFCLLAGAGGMGVLRRFGSKAVRASAVRVVVAVLMVLALGGLASDVIWPYKRRSNLVAKQVAQAVVAKISSDDRVLMGNAKSKGDFLPYLEGSDSTTFRYYLCVLSPAQVDWSIPSEQLTPIPAETWLIYFERDKRAVFTDEVFREGQLQAYLGQLAARLGPPGLEEYKLLDPYPDRPSGKVRVYCFPPSLPVAVRNRISQK